MRFRVRDEFPAAHRIRIDDQGTYEPIHVHHWRAHAILESADDNHNALPRRARALLAQWALRHRGRCLNDIEPFDVVNPTAEEVARELAGVFVEALPEARVLEVTIGEAAGFWASYRPEADDAAQ